VPALTSGGLAHRGRIEAEAPTVESLTLSIAFTVALSPGVVVGSVAGIMDSGRS
jgi:hypothetical protein